MENKKVFPEANSGKVGLTGYFKALMWYLVMLIVGSIAFYETYKSNTSVMITLTVVSGLALCLMIYRSLSNAKWKTKLYDVLIFSIAPGVIAAALSRTKLEIILLVVISTTIICLVLVLIEFLYIKGDAYKFGLSIALSVFVVYFLNQTFVHSTTKIMVWAMVLTAIATVIKCFSFIIAKSSYGIENGISEFNKNLIGKPVPENKQIAIQLFYSLAEYGMLFVWLMEGMLNWL